MQTTTPISSGLRAALDAASVLEREANPIAPGPGNTQIKSISGGLMDALQQRATADIAPASDMGQGIGSVLERLKNAVPTMQANAQEAQTNQIAQKVAAMMQGGQGDQGDQAQGYAHGGITHLPAEHHFAEGGILGFAGDGDSQLVKTSDPDLLTRINNFLFGPKKWSDVGDVLSSVAERVGKAVESGPERVQRLAREQQAQAEAQAQAQTQDQDLAQLGVGLPQGLSAAAPTAPRPPAAPAPRPAAAGAPQAGLPVIANLVAESRKGMGENADVAAARAASKKFAEAAEAAPLPGIEAIKALEEGAQRREALYNRLDKELPMRQLQVLLQGIHKGGIAGGGEAIAQFKNEQAKVEANRIAETQLEAIKRQTLKDAQTAFKLNNLKLAAENTEKLAQIATNQDQIVGNLASHAYASLMGYKGQELHAAATREASNNRMAGQFALLQARAMMGTKLSPSDLIKLQENVRSTFYSPAALQSPEFRQFVAQARNGPQLLKDIQNGRVKFDLKKGGWDSENANSTIAQAAENYKRAFINSVGPVATHAGAQPTPYEEVFKMFGGE